MASIGKKIFASAMVVGDSAKKGIVLSDIDDTFISSGGGALGQDQRFEHGTIYPGGPEMYLGLALGPDDRLPRLRGYVAEESGKLCPEGVTWLSARAANTAIVKWFAGAIKPNDRISMALSDIGKKHGFSFGTSGGLYGKFKDNFSVKESSSSSKAHTKYTNLQQFFATCGSDRRHFFLGDNGEGDEILSIKLLESNMRSLQACFIHKVSRYPAKEVNRIAATKFKDQGRLIYYETYLGAATQAFIRKYLSITGLVRVASAIFMSLHYSYCVIIRVILRYSTFHADSDSSSGDELDGKKGIKQMIKSAHFNTNSNKRLALLLEMKHASRKNYSDKQLINELTKRVGDDFWSWCVSMQQDELKFEKVINALTTTDNNISNDGIQAAAQCWRLRNKILHDWDQSFVDPTVPAPRYDRLLKETLKKDVQIERQRIVIENLLSQLRSSVHSPESPRI